MTVQPVPKWLDRKFLECLLGEQVQQFATSPAVPPGNNFGGCITRVAVRLKDRKLSIIVKSELTVGDFKDNFDFPRSCEHDFYHRFLPAAEKLTTITFAPKSIPSPRPDAMVLEDLKELGFSMADRCEQLNFAHCKLYVLAAAKFHAVSLVVIKTEPDVMESMREEKLYAHELKAAGVTKRMIAQGTECFLKATANVDKFKKARQIVRDVRGHLWDMLVDAHKRDNNAINTINQGDPWTTNMMFKYDDVGEVTDVRLLDFQVLRIGSPVNDLFTFFWGSANHDVKENSIPELYNIYLEHFNGHLKDFNCSEVLTRDELMDKMRKLSPLILLFVTTYLPLSLDPLPIDVDKFLRDDSFYEQYYHEKFCTNHLPRLIDQMEKSGVLEYTENYLKEFLK